MASIISIILIMFIINITMDRMFDKEDNIIKSSTQVIIDIFSHIITIFILILSIGLFLILVIFKYSFFYVYDKYKILGRIIAKFILKVTIAVLIILIPFNLAILTGSALGLLISVCFTIYFLIFMWFIAENYAMFLKTSNKEEISIIKNKNKKYVIYIPIIVIGLATLYSVSTAMISSSFTNNEPIKVYKTFEMYAKIFSFTLVFILLYLFSNIYIDLKRNIENFKSLSSWKRYIAFNIVFLLCIILPLLEYSESIIILFLTLGLIYVALQYVLVYLKNKRSIKISMKIVFIIMTALYTSPFLIYYLPIDNYETYEVKDKLSTINYIDITDVLDDSTVSDYPALVITTMDGAEQFLEYLNDDKLSNLEYLSIQIEDYVVGLFEESQPSYTLDLTKLPNLKVLELGEISNFADSITVDITGLDKLEKIVINNMRIDKIEGVSTLGRLREVVILDYGFKNFDALIELPKIENDYCYVVNRVEQCNLEEEPVNYSEKYLWNEKFEYGEMVPSLNKIYVGKRVDEINQEFGEYVDQYGIQVYHDLFGYNYKNVTNGDTYGNSWYEVIGNGGNYEG